MMQNPVPGRSSVPAARAAAPRAGRQRGPLDAGMVALAISTMNFYWSLPMLLDQARARRAQRAAQPPSPPAAPDEQR